MSSQISNLACLLALPFHRTSRRRSASTWSSTSARGSKGSVRRRTPPPASASGPPPRRYTHHLLHDITLDQAPVGSLIHYFLALFLCNVEALPHVNIVLYSILLIYCFPAYIYFLHFVLLHICTCFLLYSVCNMAVV